MDDTDHVTIKTTGAEPGVYFATFGVASPLSRKIIGIIAPSHEAARIAVSTVFGNKWAFVYDAVEGGELSNQMREFSLGFLFCLKATLAYEHTYNTEVIGQAEFDAIYSERIK